VLNYQSNRILVYIIFFMLNSTFNYCNIMFSKDSKDLLVSHPRFLTVIMSFIFPILNNIIFVYTALRFIKKILSSEFCMVIYRLFHCGLIYYSIKIKYISYYYVKKCYVRIFKSVVITINYYIIRLNI